MISQTLSIDVSCFKGKFVKGADLSWVTGFQIPSTLIRLVVS